MTEEDYKLFFLLTSSYKRDNTGFVDSVNLEGQSTYLICKDVQN